MRKLAQIGFLILVMLQLISAALGQGQANIAGLLLASNFTGWSVGQGNNGNYTWTSNTFCRVSAGGLTFNAFTVGVPVYLADTSAPNTSEVVTPTAVVINNSGCSIRINPVNQHQTFYFRTATAGMGEAIGYANNQNFQVILTPQWQQLGGRTSMITSSIGSTNVSILDQRNSVIVPYVWSGSAYVAQPFGGGGGACPSGCVTSVNALGSGPISGAVTFQGAGSTVINQVGQTITISSTGTGGGPLGTLPFDTPVNNVGGTTAVDTYQFFATTGYTPQQAYTAAAANNGTFVIQPTAGRVPFVATGNNRAIDMRADVPATAIGITEKGAVCDLTSIYGTFTSGSKAFAVQNTSLNNGRDVGKHIVAVGTVSGVPTVFDSVVATITDSLHGTVTSNFPFTQSTAHQMDLGHDDTTAITNTMNQVGGGGTLVFPEGDCLTHTQILRGQSPIGLGPGSFVANFPGEDTFQAPDPSQTTGVNQGAADIHNLSFQVDARIDATLPWQYISDSGTTAKLGVYRPIAQKSAVANNPLAPGWFQGSGPNASGAFNSVASVQAGSALMCVPTGATVPTVGTQVVYPYLSSVFTTTVLNNSGSCPGGTTARTMNAAMPAGSTNAQAEFFAGTSAQNLQTSIGSGSCPATITLANNIDPVAGFESNVAPFGLIQIDAEQFTYTSKTVAANHTPLNTLYGVQCAQNGTARAAHSSAATVVPLNPYKPAYAWPVTPTLNASDTTPAGTSGYYPGWNVGNAAFAFPVITGISAGSGSGGAWNANAHIHDLSFFTWPNDINGLNWQEVNHTAMLYYVPPSYATTFSNIWALYLFYGIAGGPPSIENGNWATAQPTGDGTHWDGVQIWAANPVNIPAGNEVTYSNFNVYSNENSITGSQLGADTCFYYTAIWNDQTGGITQANSLDHFKNMYCEAETGPHQGTMVGWEMDTFNSEIEDQHMGTGIEYYAGGGAQHWFGGNFNQGASIPLTNFGNGNTSDYVNFPTGLGGAPNGNVYGTNALINFAPWSNWNGQINGSGPYQFLQSGNSRQPCPAQTNEMFATGNLTAPYTSSQCGLIGPEEFNTSTSFEPSPMNVGWTFDDSSPVTHAYTACNVGNSGGTIYCNPFRFNQSNIFIGKDQRLVPGKYLVTVSAKDKTTSSNSFNMIFGVTSGCPVGAVTKAIPIKNTWPASRADYFTTTVDLTGATPGCGLAFAIEGATTADQIQIGYVDYSPLPEDFYAARIDTTGPINTAGDIFDGGQSGNSGKCVQFGTGGQLVAAAAACGTGGGGGTTTNTLTMNNSGSGAASGAAFNGASAITLSYNTLGAAPTANPTFTGTVTGPSWNVDGSGNLTAASGVFAGPHTGIAGLGTSTLALGAPAGSGATSPACASGVVCDSLSATFTFTSGTSTTTGTIGTVTFPGTKINVPTCNVQVRAGTTYFGEDGIPGNTSGSVTLPITVAVSLPASTVIRVKVQCFGQ